MQASKQNRTNGEESEKHGGEESESHDDEEEGCGSHDDEEGCDDLKPQLICHVEKSHKLKEEKAPYENHKANGVSESVGAGEMDGETLQFINE